MSFKEEAVKKQALIMNSNDMMVSDR